MSIGVVVNPQSRRHRGGSALAERLRQVLGDRGEVALSTTKEALAEIAQRFRERGISVLAVSGGDGTAGFVLSAFEKAYAGARLPRVALLRGGTMNTVANAMGVPRRNEVALLERLVHGTAGGAPLVSAPRVAMAIEHEDGTRRLGFLFGMGLARGFLDEYYAHGTPHPTPLTAARTLAQIAGSILVGGDTARRVVSPVEVVIALDGNQWPKERYLVVLAGTVSEVGLGFTPFFRVGAATDAFQVVGVHGAPPAVVARLHRVWRGQHIGDAVGSEALAVRATFTCPSGNVPYFLDGDLYEAKGVLRASVGPRIEFVWA